MRKNKMNFNNYQQTLFNKYEINESYLQTKKQQRACLELLEKIDKNESFDESKIMEKMKEAFKGTVFHKKIASSMTIAALMITLQSTPAMASAAYSFTPSAVTAETLTQAVQDNSVVMDKDSFNNKKAVKKQQLETSSIHLISSKALKNDYATIAENTVHIDGDSDISYYNKEDFKVLTVIDTSIKGWEILRDSVKEGEILLLEKGDNPLNVVLSKLEQMKQVDSLNIISHGSSGELIFKNSEISMEELEKNQNIWKSIGSHLSQDGDIQLFGCNIAEGKKGATFVKKLAEITEADVAASINPTGGEEKGGDWNLEMVTGDIESNLPFVKEAISNFDYLLLPTGSQSINFHYFTQDGLSLKNNYFTVSGYVDGVQKQVGSFTPYINDNTSTGSVNTIKIQADGTNLGSFELENISLYNYSYATPNNYLKIYGYQTNGDKINISSDLLSGMYSSSSFSNWISFDNAKLKGLAIKWKGSNTPNALNMWDFTVKNMTAPTAPAVSGVSISGTTNVGETLTGNYIYSDANGDAEGASTFKWYRSDDASGTNKTEIEGVTGKTYVLQDADLKKYISFEVTPVASTGITTGTAVESSKTSFIKPQNSVDGGECGVDGDNLLWYITNESGNYTLNIIGSGDMKNCYDSYYNKYIPWHNYASSIKSLVLKNGITGIGAYAFKDLSSLTGDITIPESVTSIGQSAFSSCSGFDKVIIPSSVTSIGENAFANWKAGSYIYNLSNVDMTSKYSGSSLGTVYTINTNIDGNTSTTKVSGDGQTTYSPIDPIKAGYIFEKWYTDNGFNNEWTGKGQIITSDLTLYARFQPEWLATYRGAQMRANSDGTYDIRFVATVNMLDPDAVGFVLSKSETNPTKETANTNIISTIRVYNSITAMGSTVTAESLGGTYIIACTIKNIPASDVGTPLYVRAFATKGTETTYTEVHIVTVSGLEE